MNTEEKMKIHKKKKKVGELVADSIDNTAPVRKILEDLNQKNAQAYSVYKHTLKQRRTTLQTLTNLHFTVPGHPLYAFSKDWDGQLDASFFEPFRHKSFPPNMINNIRYKDKCDPVTEQLKLKADWNRATKILRHIALLNKMTDKYEKLNDDVVRCPKHLVDIAAHLDSDPDRYFNSSYNWYYAGNGNIQVICINWEDYMLHSELSCLFLTEFNKVDTIMNSSVAKFDCGEGLNILETICSSENIVALRTINRVYILKIVISEDKMEFETLKLFDSELPFTGISFDGYHKNILYVTALDKVTIVNLTRMIGQSVKLKANTSTLVDNWNTVIGADRSFFTHIGRKSVSLYDKRSNGFVCAWTDLRKVTDETHCNDISAAMLSDTAPLLYVTTDHHLFALDLRYCERDKIAAAQRWTHGMLCVPTYITRCGFGTGKDLICLSSHWCEDMCVVPNYSRRGNSDQCCLTIPYRPPSILRALEEARANKLCSDLYNPIDGRLHTAITGCVVLEQGEKYNVLLQNALGDVSCHAILPEHLLTFVLDESAQQLHRWSESYTVSRKEFEVSDVVDIAHVWKALRKVPEGCLLGDQRTTYRGKDRFNEKEIFDAFENGEIDSELLELWMRNPEETVVEQSSGAMNLHFSDSE